MDGTDSGAITSSADLLALVPSDLFSGPTADVSADAVETGDSDTGGGVESEPESDITGTEGGSSDDDAAADDSGTEAEADSPDAAQPWADKILGEKLTPEALKARQQSHQTYEALYNAATGGDPAEQARVVDFLLEEGARRRDAGEVGVDPSIGLAQAFYERIKERSPDAHAQLMLAAHRDHLTSLFEAAEERGDNFLLDVAWRHLQTLTGAGPDADVSEVLGVARKLGLPFPDEWISDQTARKYSDSLAGENARLKSQIEQRGQASQFDSWREESLQSTQQAVITEALLPALAGTSAQNSQQTLAKLAQAVTERIGADKGFVDRLETLNRQAARAASPKVRGEIASEMKRLLVNRSKLVAEQLRPQVLKASGAKQVSAKPKATASKMGDTYDPKIALRMMRDLLD